jgi:PAS domain S-box-containing protein
MMSEEMLSKIIDGSPIPSFVINKQHLVTHWNLAIEALSGLKKQEIIGTSDQWRAFYNQKRPVMADLIVDNASPKEIEGYYKGKCKRSNLIDGAYQAEDFFPDLGRYGKWLDFTASPIKNEQGEIVAAIETLQDMTDQKIAQEALYNSEQNYRDLFESALDAIWVHDLKGDIQVANKAAAKLIGYSLEEMWWLNISSFMTAESLKLNNEIQEKLINHESVEMPYQEKLKRKDGLEIIVEITTRLIAQNNLPTAFQNIARDVTLERKIKESLRFYLQKVLAAQEDERKRIARDLHDDTAQSLLLLMRKLDALVSDRRIKLSKKIREELTRSVSLSMDIHAGIRRYAQELRPAILDDLGLVPALEWIFDNLGTECGITVDTKIDPIKSDLPRETQLVLFRIAQEAITNIKKHAETSKVVFRLLFEDNKMRMVITDFGKGFKMPARLGDLGTAGKLGLVGMQERAQLLNGTFDIQSEPGKGTSIVVEIPLEINLKQS